MNDNELRELRTILNAIANQHGLLQWVNAWAHGRNEGGGFVSLFHDRLRYRVCTVYEERFRELPAFIRDNLPEDGDGVEISTDRTVLERKGLLRPCTPFEIARYSVGDGEKAAWRFSGVVRVAREQAAPQTAQGKPQEPKPPPQPAPTLRDVTTWANARDAVEYGVLCGAYDSYELARVAYNSIKAQLQPTAAAEMYTAWANHVEGVVRTDQQFNAATPAERGATAPASAGAKMRQRMAGVQAQ